MAARFVRQVTLLGLVCVIVLSMNAAFASQNIVPETHLGYWSQRVTEADVYPDGTPTPRTSPTPAGGSELAEPDTSSPDTASTTEPEPALTEQPKTITSTPQATAIQEPEPTSMPHATATAHEEPVPTSTPKAMPTAISQPSRGEQPPPESPIPAS